MFFKRWTATSLHVRSLCSSCFSGVLVPFKSKDSARTPGYCHSVGLQRNSGEKDSVVSEERLEVWVEGDGCCGQRECCFSGRYLSLC